MKVNKLCTEESKLLEAEGLSGSDGLTSDQRKKLKKKLKKKRTKGGNDGAIRSTTGSSSIMNGAANNADTVMKKTKAKRRKNRKRSSVSVVKDEMKTMELASEPNCVVPLIEALGNKQEEEQVLIGDERKSDEIDVNDDDDEGVELSATKEREKTFAEVILRLTFFSFLNFVFESVSLQHVKESSPSSLAPYISRSHGDTVAMLGKAQLTMVSTDSPHAHYSTAILKNFCRLCRHLKWKLF